jgi:hypothetical protein
MHRHCGDTFWQKVAAAMQDDFRAGNFTHAICLDAALTM